MTQVTGTLKAPRREYAPGDLIGGKYGLLRLLGEGGMGSVWVAENLALKANVALKLIRADVAESSANERFLSEARLAARLQHAAIVRVFDFGKTEQDEPYIVMELLDGETLGQRLSRLGAIDPMDLCQTLLPIIDALHSAHGHGVIHRDLKPDNVFIAKADGGGVQPKLLDFGIAKLRGESAFHTTKLTQAGTLIGSPDYMSPEQARGETDLDPRSDVWALCVLAYECLVGKPPFHGDNYNALLWAIIHDEPVPITVFQAGDAELWRILKTGFAKDRNVRWESARKLGEAIAAWLESHGVVEDVCNRSLHASWLPTERPTRPELTPFDPFGASNHRAASMHEADVPQPTLAALRRPHAMSLWFAGLGLLTLVGALVLSKSEDTLSVEPGRQQVDALLPTQPRRPASLPSIGSGSGRPQGSTATGSGQGHSPGLPGPAPETLEPYAETQPARALEGQALDRGDVPIGSTAGEGAGNSGSSWKQNHDRASNAREAVEDDSRSGVKATRGVTEPSQVETKKRAAPKPAPKPVEAARPKPPRAVPKKAPPPEPADTEVDFGI
jgi:serine/threonine protein kinase